jgi:hypothetical protein
MKEAEGTPRTWRSPRYGGTLIEDAFAYGLGVGVPHKRKAPAPNLWVRIGYWLVMATLTLGTIALIAFVIYAVIEAS